MAKFIVYGQGISSSAIVRGGEETFVASMVRRGLVAENKHERLTLDDAWCVEVECDEANLDTQTRRDSATIGYYSIGTDDYSASEHHQRFASMSLDELVSTIRESPAVSRGSEVGAVLDEVIGADSYDMLCVSTDDAGREIAYIEREGAHRAYARLELDGSLTGPMSDGEWTNLQASEN
jgi:hypothetical protein